MAQDEELVEGPQVEMVMEEDAERQRQRKGGRESEGTDMQEEQKEEGRGGRVQGKRRESVTGVVHGFSQA